MSAPPVQQLGPAVLFQGRMAATELARVVSTTVRMQRRDGIEPSGFLRDTLAALLAAAEHATQADSGTPEARNSAELALSWHDEIGTQEAAEMMRCSTEWVRKLAREGRLGATRILGGRRVVSRAGVATYLEDQVSA